MTKLKVSVSDEIWKTDHIRAPGWIPFSFILECVKPVNRFRWKAEYPDLVEFLNKVAEQNRKFGKEDELTKQVRDKVKW